MHLVPLAQSCSLEGDPPQPGVFGGRDLSSLTQRLLRCHQVGEERCNAGGTAKEATSVLIASSRPQALREVSGKHEAGLPF